MMNFGPLSSLVQVFAFFGAQAPAPAPIAVAAPEKMEGGELAGKLFIYVGGLDDEPLTEIVEDMYTQAIAVEPAEQPAPAWLAPERSEEAFELPLTQPAIA